MDLTKRQRELIGRATAFLVALLLGWWAYRCLDWAKAARNDPVAAEMQRTGVHVRRHDGQPIAILYSLAFLFASLSIGLAGVSIAPSLTVDLLERSRGNPGEPRDGDWQPPPL